MMHDDWDGHGWSWGGWLGMGLMMTAFIALLVLLVVLVLRALEPPSARQAPAAGSTGGPPPAPPGSAERLLAERFARGEIDAAEYSARREVLDR